MGRPAALQRTWILVPNPPHERPWAWFYPSVFSPAAQRCTRTMVLSIICSSSSRYCAHRPQVGRPWQPPRARDGGLQRLDHLSVWNGRLRLGKQVALDHGKDHGGNLLPESSRNPLGPPRARAASGPAAPVGLPAPLVHSVGAPVIRHENLTPNRRRKMTPARLRVYQSCPALCSNRHDLHVFYGCSARHYDLSYSGR
jgi:hypothetical protein